MSGKKISQSETRIEALKLQSSAYGVVIAMVWGVNRLAGNMLWYGNFQRHPKEETQGGKGGTKQVSETATYTASVMMALGHGRITDVPRAWVGKRVYEGGITPSQILTAFETYAVPGSGAMSYTTAHAATFAAHVIATVTDGVGIDTYASTLQIGTDVTVQAGVYTVLDDRFRGRTVTFEYQYTSGGYTQDALQELGLTFIPGELGQAAWSGLASFGVQNIGYSGLAAVAGVDYDLGSSASVDNHTFEVVGPMAYHLGATVPDVDPARMLRDLLSNARAGANFPGEALDDWDQFSDYCVANGLLVSPVLTTQASAAEIVARIAELTNAMPVWSSRRLKMVPRSDTAATGNGRTYTPAVTPAYALDDDCYTPPAGTVPVRMMRRRPADRWNHVRVEYQDRGQQYNTAIEPARDVADIEARGLRSSDIVDAKGWIASAGAARMAAQLIMQRSLHVTADFEFYLPWHYARLEPGDIVTLTDAGLGLSARGAIVTDIEEAEDGRLRVKAEEYPAGSNAAPAYPSASSSGYQHDYNVAPGNAGAPIIFEVPAELSSTGLGVYVAVPAGASANWGGAQVWVSLDGTNYRMLGIANAGARAGALNGAAAANASTIAVDGLGTQQLVSGSAADAAALSTLCYVGGANPEYFAYTTATLTGAGAYTLGGLGHGAYGTPRGAHADNDPFVRVDERLLRSEDLDRTMVGKTLYIKVCSFNLYGGAQQGLADVSATTYVVTGAMVGYRAVTERGNLLDPSAWVNGGSGTQGFVGGNLFSQATPAGTNLVGLSGTPDGALRPIWQADSTGTSSYAGWESNAKQFAVKPTEVIRYSVWVKHATISGTPGTLYFGPAGGGGTAIVTSGAQETNPYFATTGRTAFVQGRWYLLVGFVLPSSSGTTQQNKGGIYDGVTGQKVNDYTDFKWRTDVVASGHRVFMFGASSGNRCEFWGPRAELCDGTEPSVDELLAVAKQSSSGVSALDFANAIGLNGQFTNWALANAFPDGWGLWAGTAQVKETAITRTGPNALRFNVASGEAGAFFTWTPTIPPPLGSWLRIALDMYIVANTSGNKPGMLVRMWTDAGFTTYRDVVLQPATLTTGAWQTISANASVRPNELIYRITFYLMGSWNSMPGGGTWVGQVIFDSLVIDMMSPTNADQLAENATVVPFLVPETADDVSASSGSQVETLASYSYTNNTGGPVVVQWDCSIQGFYIDGASSSKDASAFWYYTVNGTLPATTAGMANVATASPGPVVGSHPGQVSLAAGDVLALEMRVVVNAGAGGATAHWSSGFLRGMVFKRAA